MRLLIVLIASSILSGTTEAGTHVDRLVHDLDSLSLHSFDEWKVSPDLRNEAMIHGDPTKIGFDDSSWKTLRINESIYLDSCWIRKEIVLPDKILGKPIQGPVRFLVSVDDYGYLWVNGLNKGHFPWNGEFELTRQARPGERFVVVIKAINTGGPLRLLRASFESELARPASDLIRELSLSLQVAQKLLSFDTYQTNARLKVDPRIDRAKMDRQEKVRMNELLQSTVSEFDLGMLTDGNLEGFRASIDRLKGELKPVADHCKRFTLHFVSNAHIDAAWLWRERETVEVCKNTFNSVLNMMDTRPDFTYVQSSAVYYKWMEDLYPEVFEGIRRRVIDGRWEIVGGMWVEPDCNLPSGESWARHLLYSKRYFKQKFGVDVKIGWNPDSFGYNWNMPQIYREAGIDAFITQKIGWNELNVFPHRVFWWEAPGGSRILTYFPFDYVNEVTNPHQLVDWLRQFEANTGLTRMMVLFGVGDHGGGPSPEMLDRVERLKAMEFYPKIEYGTASKYIDWLKQQDLGDLPVWTDELYLEYHQGTFTTQSAMKQFNRRSEVLLTNAEKYATLATLYGGNYNRNALEEAWQHMLFNQFHDILPGSSIREVYLDATKTHQEAQEIGNHELTGALRTITAEINTAGIKSAAPVVVFNPLSWERTDIVRLTVPDDESEYTIVGSDGKEVPSQIVDVRRYTKEILFIAEGVPSVGYKLYGLKKRKTATFQTTLRIDSTSVENEDLRVAVDRETGWLKSIYDKRNNRELLDGLGNRLLMLEDKPSAWDAWNIGLTGIEFPTRFKTIELVESGPIRATLRVYHEYRKPGTAGSFPTENFPTSFFTQDITLYQGISQIFFTTRVEWWEDKAMLKVAFPFAVADSVATYEIPFGYIERPTVARDSWDSAKVEGPAHRWADLSGSDYGVSLLNRAKYGHDIKGSTIRLSLLRSPRWPDPTADRGAHTIEYAVYPHRGRWGEAQTVQRGYEYNNPLIPVVTDSHTGSLPAAYSFLKINPSNLVLTSIKKAEDSEAWIIQFYDSQDQKSLATLEFPRTPKKAMVSNFLEENGPPLIIKGKTLTVPVRARGVVTMKVSY